MDEMTARLTEQLKNNPAMLQSLMQSRDGQQLLQMLTQGDQGAGFQKAIQSATAGNTAEMRAMVNRIMQSPEGAALVNRINKAVQSK